MDALLESEIRILELAENFREVVWMCDVDEFKVLYVSPSYERIWGRSCQSLYQHPNKIYEDWFGRPCAEITGKPIKEIIGPSAYEKIRPHVEAALSQRSLMSPS